MKKTLLVPGILWLLALNACKEIGPSIDFTPPPNDTAFSVDTSFMAAPEAPELRRVLAEEATGVRCPNCPAGTLVLTQAEAAHPGRIIVVGLHAGGLTLPLTESLYDFRTQYAMDLFTFFGGEPNKPAATFDRSLQSGSYFIENKNLWNNAIAQRLAVAATANLSVTSSFDAANNQDTIRLNLRYTQEVLKKQAITIVIVEDSIVDAQDNSGTIVTNYVHNHVLRTMLTPVAGKRILDTVAVQSGRVYERAFIYKLPENASQWNLDHCKLIVFVHNDDPGDKEVGQAAETELK